MIQFDSVNFYYSKGKPLFQQLELQVQTGKIYGLLGTNGTGKSTLLKLLVGALFPKKGSITLQKPDAHHALQPKHRPVELLQDIFFLPEQFQYPPVSAITFLRMEAAFYPKFDLQLLNRLMGDFDIPTSTKLNRLSYGQQKKFMIAFGLACKTTYLFMDEPTNGLDIPSKSKFRKAIASNLEDHQVVIISTHQVSDIDKLIDSIIILKQGQVLLNSDIAEIEQKVSFIKNKEKPERDDVLYTENILGGFISIVPNSDDIISDVELEILFNAFTTNAKAMSQLFK